MTIRQAIIAVACSTVLVSTVAQAQVGPIVPLLIPSPVGVVLSVGSWIYDAATKERVYYIEVQGDGVNADEARKNGFRIAVEQAVGSIMASESVTQNSRLARDEIIMYSSGFVEKYEIIRQEAGGLGVKTSMRVWVRRNPIANRLLNESKTAGRVEGTQAVVSLDTLVTSRVAGDRLVNSVTADLTKNGFDISAGKPRVELDGQSRSANLYVPYSMNWNSDYLAALWSALDATSTGNGYVAAVTVKFPGLALNKTAYYADENKYKMLMSRVFYRKPQIEMRLVDDQDRVVYQDTFPIKFFTPPHDPALRYYPTLVEINTKVQRGIQINGNATVRDNLLIQNVDPGLLSRVQRVELRVI